MQHGMQRTGVASLPWLLIDANELDMWDNRREPEAEDDGRQALCVAYGVMLWAPGPNADAEVERAEKIAEIRRGPGHDFRHLTRDGKARCSVVEDIRFHPFAWPRHVPIVALVRTAEPIPDAGQQGLTLFPRYEGMDYLANLLNQPAVLCLKGEERRARKAVNVDQSCWAQTVDPRRAEMAARGCR